MLDHKPNFVRDIMRERKIVLRENPIKLTL